MIFYIYVTNKPFKLALKNNEKVSISLSAALLLVRLLEDKWIMISGDSNQLTLRGPNDEVISCRTSIGWDFGHLVEIFIDKSYGSDFHNQNIIDIGMSNGDSSIYFAKYGAKRVIAVEPDKRSFGLALNNIKRSNVDDIVTPINKALSSNANKIELIVNDSSPNANSVDERNMVTLKGSTHKESVEGITLNNIIDMFNGEQIDLLKMDCEGCEYSVLSSLDGEYYKKILNISMEYHNGLQEIPKILEQNGFTLDIKNSNQLMGYIKASKK